ncbi:hypothetical protein Esti_004175 [Eimeria stiedai]
MSPQRYKRLALSRAVEGPRRPPGGPPSSRHRELVKVLFSSRMRSVDLKDFFMASKLLLLLNSSCSRGSSDGSNSSSRMSSTSSSSTSSRISATRRATLSLPHPSHRNHHRQQQQQHGDGETKSWRLLELVQAATLLHGSSRVLIVPGFGVAASRCSAELAELAKLLLSAGSQVNFALSPIAGRIPGHISLFLQGVPDHLIKTGKQANACILTYDLCLVVGADSVVNPAFKEKFKAADGAVVEVWKAAKVVVLRRSVAPPLLPSRSLSSQGFRLEEGGPPSPADGGGPPPVEEASNPLLLMPHVGVVPGDAKKSLSSLIVELRRLGVGAGSEPRAGGWPPLQVDDGFLEEETVRTRWPRPEATVGALRDALGGGVAALDPEGVGRLRQLGFAVLVERQSPAAAAEAFSDEEYRLSGAGIAGVDRILEEADVLLHPSSPPLEYFLSDSSAPTTPATTTTAATAATAAAGGKGRIRQGRVLVCAHPRGRPSALLEALASQGWLVVSLEGSSPALQARGIDLTASLEAARGYRAFIEAMHALPRLVKGLTTAAGRIEPAAVLVVGAGVVGLHAAATAHKAGAKVFVLDVHAKAQSLAESVGAAFLPALCSLPRWEALSLFPKVHEGLRLLIEKADIVICSPPTSEGGPPPLIPRAWLQGLKDGAVVVDMAAGHPQAAAGWCGAVEVEGGGPEAPPPRRGSASGTEADGEEGGRPAHQPAPQAAAMNTRTTVISGVNVEAVMPREVSRIVSASACNLLEAVFLEGASGKGPPPPLSLLRFRELDEVLQNLVLVKDGEVIDPPHWGLLKGRRTISRRLSSVGSSAGDGADRGGGPLGDAGSKFF